MGTSRRQASTALPEQPLDPGNEDSSARDAETRDEASAGRDPDQTRRQRIAERAYRRAEGRGFAPGQELDDWLAAEADEREGAEQEPERLRRGT